jgi:hypothetical protein
MVRGQGHLRECLLLQLCVSCRFVLVFLVILSPFPSIPPPGAGPFSGGGIQRRSPQCCARGCCQWRRGSPGPRFYVRGRRTGPRRPTAAAPVWAVQPRGGTGCGGLWGGSGAAGTTQRHRHDAGGPGCHTHTHAYTHTPFSLVVCGRYSGNGCSTAPSTSPAPQWHLCDVMPQLYPTPPRDPLPKFLSATKFQPPPPPPPPTHALTVCPRAPLLFASTFACSAVRWFPSPWVTQTCPRRWHTVLPALISLVGWHSLRSVPLRR